MGKINLKTYNTHIAIYLYSFCSIILGPIIHITNPQTWKGPSTHIIL